MIKTSKICIGKKIIKFPTFADPGDLQLGLGRAWQPFAENRKKIN